MLTMLAEGHTAKTIARAINVSVNAVNERLREARRKTGASSSRDLARLLRSQENRDEEIGVAGLHARREAMGAAPSHIAIDAQRKVILFMSLIVIGIGAIALFSSSPQGVEKPVDDPLLDSLIGTQPDGPDAYYAKVRSERRDPAWAAAQERSLRRRFAALKEVDARSIRIICGASVCEVAGTLAPTPRPGPAIVKLQKEALASDGVRGLTSGSFSAGSRQGTRKSWTFVSYQRRADIPATAPATDRAR